MKNLTLLACLFLLNVAFSQDISFDNGSYTKNETAYTGKLRFIMKAEPLRRF